MRLVDSSLQISLTKTVGGFSRPTYWNGAAVFATGGIIVCMGLFIWIFAIAADGDVSYSRPPASKTPAAGGAPAGQPAAPSAAVQMPIPTSETTSTTAAPSGASGGVKARALYSCMFFLRFAFPVPSLRNFHHVFDSSLTPIISSLFTLLFHALAL
jgi:hypothetical protein